VRVTAREPAETRRFAGTLRDMIRSAARRDVLHQVTRSSIGLISTLGLYIIVFIAAYRVTIGVSTWGTLVAFFLYLMRLMNAAGSVMQLNPQIRRALASLQRIFDLPDKAPESRASEPMPRLRGEVAYENVSFSYDGLRPALHEVSFHARPGEVIALVG